MKYNDHEFDPVTDEERAAREREEELARRIRREVLRVQSGEADEEIRADREREQAEEEARQEEQRKEERRRSNIFWLLFSGNILVRKGASEYYRYMICIAAMFFVSIFVMFTALHLDMKYSRLYREVRCCASARRAFRSSVSAILPTRPSSKSCADGASTCTTRSFRVKFSTTDEQDETGKIAHQKRHPAAGEVALHPLHPGGTAHLRTSGMGAALQLGGRLQCRTARRTHLHRTDHPGAAGNILTRDGDPLATSIFRYRVEFDFGSPGLDSVRTFHEQSDSLSNYLPPISATDPQPNIVACSARSMPNTTR